MRALPLTVLLLLATAASAQVGDQPSDPWSRVGVVTGGASDNGASLRMLRGVAWNVGGPLRLGVAHRSMISYTPSIASRNQILPSEKPVPSIYLESGVSARAAAVVGRAEVALSAGLAGASRTYAWAPFDAGLVSPIEVEASARVWRSVGVTASASVSLPITSVWSNQERFSPDYSLENRAVTVGLRFGM